MRPKSVGWVGYSIIVTQLRIPLFCILPRMLGMGVLSRSVGSDSVWPHGLQTSTFLSPWGFSRQEYWRELPRPSPGDPPNPGIKPRSPALQVYSLPSKPPGKLCAVLCLVAQPYLTLCDPADCSPRGSSVCGILQARIVEWIAMPSSRGPFQPRDQTQVSRIADRFFTI